MLNNQKFTPKKPEILLRRISKSFPDLKWSSYQINNEGWDHEILILDDSLVFRFPNEEDYLKYLKTEVTVLQHLKTLVSVNIPDYIYIPSDFSFAGYRLIPGQPLLIGTFNSLNQATKTGLAKQLADFLSTMHTLVNNDGKFNSVMHSDLGNYQREMKQQAAQYLKPVLSKLDFTIVENILAVTDNLLTKHLPQVLIHGDIYHDHLLWDSKNDKLGIIDFSDINIGDPAFDFAELYEYGENYVHTIYDYYTGPKDGTFLERAWNYQKWVGVFMMINHFIYHKTSFEKARQTFDRVKSQSGLNV